VPAPLVHTSFYYQAPSLSLCIAPVLVMSTSTWKPDTCPSLIPTLCIEGASAALAWYRKAYDAESTDVMHDQSSSKLLHSCLALAGDGKFFLADPMNSMGFRPSVANLYLYVPDVDATFKKAVEAAGPGRTSTAKRQPKETRRLSEAARRGRSLQQQWRVEV
jgi:PhnB protein